MKFNDLNFFDRCMVRVMFPPLCLVALIVMVIFLFVKYFIDLPRAVGSGRLTTMNEIYSGILQEVLSLMGAVIIKGDFDAFDKY